ncbi:hypothetical protein U1Q18_031376, partial [Sarracenia purpurea var. burkii]
IVGEVPVPVPVQPEGKTNEEERHDMESSPVVEDLRKENAQLLKQIEEMKEREE